MDHGRQRRQQTVVLEPIADLHASQGVVGDDQKSAAAAVLLNADQNPSQRVQPSKQDVVVQSTIRRRGVAMRIRRLSRRSFRGLRDVMNARSESAKRVVQVLGEHFVDRPAPQDVVILLDEHVLRETANERALAVDGDRPRPDDRRLKKPERRARGRSVDEDRVSIPRFLIDHPEDEQPMLGIAADGQRRDGRIGRLRQFGQRAHIQRHGVGEESTMPVVGTPRRRAILLVIELQKGERADDPPAFFGFQAREIEGLQQPHEHDFRRRTPPVGPKPFHN